MIMMLIGDHLKQLNNISVHLDKNYLMIAYCLFVESWLQLIWLYLLIYTK